MIKLPLSLSLVFLKIFLRDRQAIFFSLFFPIVFMLVFGFVANGEPDSIEIGIVNEASSPLAAELVDSLAENPSFQITSGNQAELRRQLVEGELTLVLFVPESFNEASAPTELTVLVDASQARELSLIMPVLEQGLSAAERQLRDQAPLFTLTVEDVQARSQRYIDFLVPGLLAFTLMQLSIAGSGFNIVEYRRKGILKRLFVTPIKPREFILALVISRAIICVLQLSILLLIAVLFLDVPIVGSPVALYFIIITGTAIFLSLGFCIGSFAKTQHSVMAMGNIVVFPQIFLAGVFYPIDALPAFLQPVATLLPLSFVVNALRDIIVNGLPLLGMGMQLVGIVLWLCLALILAIRCFDWKEVAS